MDIELKQYLDEQFRTIVTKADLETQSKNLKAYADEQTEKLALIIATTIAEPIEKNFSELKDFKTIQEEVLVLKTDIEKIKTALQLT